MLDYSRDEALTAEYYRRGTFRDDRSFVDQAGHLHLRGIDRSDAREKLYLARKGRCETCNHYRDREHADMHHLGKTPKTRCECYRRRLNDGTFCTGIAWVCSMRGGANSCHAKIHNREIGGSKGQRMAATE